MDGFKTRRKKNKRERAETKKNAEILRIYISSNRFNGDEGES